MFRTWFSLTATTPEGQHSDSQGICPGDISQAIVPENASERRHLIGRAVAARAPPSVSRKLTNAALPREQTQSKFN